MLVMLVIIVRATIHASCASKQREIQQVVVLTQWLQCGIASRQTCSVDGFCGVVARRPHLTKGSPQVWHLLDDIEQEDRIKGGISEWEALDWSVHEGRICCGLLCFCALECCLGNIQGALRLINSNHLPTGDGCKLRCCTHRFTFERFCGMNGSGVVQTSSLLPMQQLCG